MDSIPRSHQDLISWEVRSFLNIATIMADGTPQVSPVWFNTDGMHILINSAEGRVKDRNMRARPNVALSITDPNNPYRYILVRGRVVEITNEGALDHINSLAKKYTGQRKHTPSSSGEIRVLYKILPERVFVAG